MPMLADAISAMRTIMPMNIDGIGMLKG